MLHENESPLAGKTVTIKTGSLAGQEFRVEDYWDRVNNGVGWGESIGNPAALIYAMRIGSEGEVPLDNEVLYGKIGYLGHLVHVSEIEGK